jgi:uncharacterized membrane protein
MRVHTGKVAEERVANHILQMRPFMLTTDADNYRFFDNCRLRVIQLRNNPKYAS